MVSVAAVSFFRSIHMQQYSVFRLNHAVKRHKPNEDQKPQPSRHRRDLYEGLQHLTPTAVSSNLPAIPEQSNHNAQSNESSTETVDGENKIKTEANIMGNSLMSDENLLHDIKKEPVDGEDAKAIESLYTSKGLQPSFRDLDQLFDDDDSGGSPSMGVSILIYYGRTYALIVL